MASHFWNCTSMRRTYTLILMEKKITKDHWHIYREDYGRKFAIPAEDICDKDFVENTLIFLRKFHVVEPPKIYYQTEL